MALFDVLASPNTKRSMVQAMQKKKEHKSRKVKATLKKETFPTLDTLTTPVSRNLLQQLHLDDFFVEEDPELWQLSKAFLHCKDHSSKSSHC